VNELVERFATAVESSFRFLVDDMGYQYVGPKIVDLNDPRETSAVARFLHDTLSVDVRINVISLVLVVFTKRYASASACLADATPEAVVNLELQFSDVPCIHRPSWMRKGTLREEALAGFKRYGRLVQTNLEDAVQFLADRLKASQDALGLSSLPRNSS
jgi:hypothetical protein